jgi:hypothetical protein
MSVDKKAVDDMSVDICIYKMHADEKTVNKIEMSVDGKTLDKKTCCH